LTYITYNYIYISVPVPEHVRTEASLIDSERGLDKQSLTPSGSGNLNSSVAGASESAVGIAICDDQLRYVSVNPALAAMNGIPAEGHIGKTVREVIGSVASTVELMLHSVLLTGESILNAEIRGNLPTRNAEGFWIEHYFPVRSIGGVKQVGVVVVEITRLRRLENCVLAFVMGNTRRTRKRPTRLGMPYAAGEESVESWSGSIESMENLIREGLKNSHTLERRAQAPNTGEMITHQRVPLHYATSAIPNEPYSANHGLTPTGSNGANPLSPREIQLVQLLVRGNGNKEISTALGISVKTVEAYRARIMLKLQIHSLSELVLYAVRCGLVKA
jgi:DNA-binding CsgD family transcriptional regulator